MDSLKREITYLILEEDTAILLCTLDMVQIGTAQFEATHCSTFLMADDALDRETTLYSLVYVH